MKHSRLLSWLDFRLFQGMLDMIFCMVEFFFFFHLRLKNKRHKQDAKTTIQLAFHTKSVWTWSKNVYVYACMLVWYLCSHRPSYIGSPINTHEHIQRFHNTAIKWLAHNTQTEYRLMTKYARAVIVQIQNAHMRSYFQCIFV